MPQRIVIIIEDEKDVVELVANNFRTERFEVASFAHGRQGLEYLQLHPPDFLLLDIMLPDGNGVEISRRIRAASTCWTPSGGPAVR